MPASNATLALSSWLPIRSLFAVNGLSKRFRLRSLRRSLAKALIVAGLLVMWVTPSKASWIFWSNPVLNEIGRANLDGTGVNNAFITGATNPDGLAVDGTYIYWANSSNGIGRANLVGLAVRRGRARGVSP